MDFVIKKAHFPTFLQQIKDLVVLQPSFVSLYMTTGISIGVNIRHFLQLLIVSGLEKRESLNN